MFKKCLWVSIFFFSCSGIENERVSIQDELFDSYTQRYGETLEVKISEGIDSLRLIPEVFFESTDSIYIEGYISDFAVDDSGKVFVAATMAGVVGIYVFDSDGTFISKFMREGRGPGETEAISALRIFNQELYAFGPRLQKYVVYSTGDFKYKRDVVLERDFSTEDSLLKGFRATNMYLSEKGEVYLKFSNPSATYNQKERIYKIDDDGKIELSFLLEQKRYGSYEYEIKFSNGEVLPLPLTMPFSGSSIVKFAPNGDVYRTWTENSSIDVLEMNGNIQYSLDLPFQKSKLDISSLELQEGRVKILEEYGYPETWPLIHTMEVDDHGKMWVATITDSDSTYDWWVIVEDSLIASFIKPGNRGERFVGTAAPDIIIRDGYFYEKEFDIEKNINRVVKYRIEFIRREN